MLVGRSPHGERGLKCNLIDFIVRETPSLPAWGAWIEIKCRNFVGNEEVVAPRMGSVD